MLEIGLFLPVVVTAVLCLAYLRALGSRQRAVEAAGLQIARRVADQSVVEASRVGDAAAHSILEPTHRVRSATPARLLAAMQAATDSLRACRCGPLKEGAFFFVWVPETGEFTSAGRVPATTEPYLHQPAEPPPGPDRSDNIWALGGNDPTGPWLVHYTRVRLAGGNVAVVGFDISMRSWWTSTFIPAIALTRRRMFPMLADPDTAFSARLTAKAREVGHTTERYLGPSARLPILGGELFAIEITINTAILPVLLSAAVPPSYPLLLGTLGASVLVSVLALLLLRQLRHTITRREAFVASISHELRTPLTEVLLHAESLHLDRQTPEAKGRAAGAIVRETRRLIGLVENALTMAGAGRSPGTPTPAIRPASVVRESLRALQPAVEHGRARLEAALDESVVCAIDPVSLDRIVTNLLENALRYGPAGQTIGVGLSGADSSVQLSVTDEGPGVSPEERRRIWDPFERGSAAEGTARTGVGLGLAIVRYLVEEAGGRVTVTSAPGGGAEFVVLLPAPGEGESVAPG
jgi:signal transduction histidine kinase